MESNGNGLGRLQVDGSELAFKLVDSSGDVAANLEEVFQWFVVQQELTLARLVLNVWEQHTEQRMTLLEGIQQDAEQEAAKALLESAGGPLMS